MKEEILNGKLFWSADLEVTLKYDKITMKFLQLCEADGCHYWVVHSRIKHEWKTYFELEYYRGVVKCWGSLYEVKNCVSWVPGKNIQLANCIML
jgi:hypothetical protein